jgi:hypothetical protein
MNDTTMTQQKKFLRKLWQFPFSVYKLLEYDQTYNRETTTM